MSIDKKKIEKILKVTAIGTGVTFLGLNMIAKKKKGDSVFEKEKDQKNPFAGKKVVFVEDESDEENADGVRGHLEAVGETKKSKGIYDRYIKRAIDVVLSFGGLVVLSPIYAGIAIAIKIDDPGPVFFTQKRVGQNKEFFKIHKFRSMKMSTPHDVPTHMLGDPDQYITRVGKFLRKHSLDELPQIWDIFIGNMSVIGPRPALWNQDVLIAEREKYHANDVKPGLTGWAQINGRDELEIPVKAKLDGEYVEKESLLFDIKCFLGTIGSVLSSDGVVEGGTGELTKAGIGDEREISPEKAAQQIKAGAKVMGALSAAMLGMAGIVSWIFFRKDTTKSDKKKHTVVKRWVLLGAIFESIAIVFVNIKGRVKMGDDFVNDSSEEGEKTIQPVGNIGYKKVLITGQGSYIGTAVERWLLKDKDHYQVDTLDMQDETWRDTDFSQYDVVYHVAGIAHADVGNVTEEQKQLYYKVNTDLTIEVAERARQAKVKQFIFMSSMIVYSGCKENFITSETEPCPLNFYGDSKWRADQKIQEMDAENFKVVVLRPPMIYGKGSKGNYPQLAKLASKLPVFPIVKNQRSMLHIDNLCQFVKLMIDNEEHGVFFPQNGEYSNTSDMVQMIAEVKGHRIIMIPFVGIFIKLLEKVPGKIGGLTIKAFGNSSYDMSMSEYKENYRVNSLRKSIVLTEGTHLEE
ncbi:sugar nucleotide-binding protein [[Ruminococcus] gnavus]|jgi:lipopolysaccharide/colanic/teichoic acid biosynthesis glycosyltransferase/nucleoside-diphosphate-sugar epimerase|uniref:Sugar nucleotide-binding protein n=1 Tax=Mediterraneibacter gnavus TaxID=33038 RepID=A0AAJ3KJU4_MEDGN|nr:sugar transferase [Mediterraneibacter gnavus]NSI20153.1 sugar nucleotide-binding protein [Mediterraneibacter gnavus]